MLGQVVRLSSGKVRKAYIDKSKWLLKTSET